MGLQESDVLKDLKLPPSKVDSLFSLAKQLSRKHPDIHRIVAPQFTDVQPLRLCDPNDPNDTNCEDPPPPPPPPGDGDDGDDGGDDKEGCSSDYGPCVQEAQLWTAAALYSARGLWNHCLDYCDRRYPRRGSDYFQCVLRCDRNYESDVNSIMSAYLLWQLECRRLYC